MFKYSFWLGHSQPFAAAILLLLSMLTCDDNSFVIALISYLSRFQYCVSVLVFLCAPPTRWSNVMTLSGHFCGDDSSQEVSSLFNIRMVSMVMFW